MICTLLIILLLRSSSPEVITIDYDHIFLPAIATEFIIVF